MAKKRRTKRAKTHSRRVVRHSVRHVMPLSRFTVVANNLLLFIALSLVSLVLTKFLNGGFLTELFSVMAMVFGFIAVAFLITLLVLVAMKLVARKKKRR